MASEGHSADQATGLEDDGDHDNDLKPDLDRPLPIQEASTMSLTEESETRAEPDPAEGETPEDLARRLRRYRGLKGYRWAMVLALRELGGNAHKDDLAERVAAVLDLPPDERARSLPSGTGNYFEFDLSRTAQDLKAGGVIRYPGRDGSNDDLPRGYRELTTLGRRITEQELQRLFSGNREGAPGQRAEQRPGSSGQADRQRAWMLRAGTQGALAESFIEAGIAAVGFGRLQDLSEVSGRDEIAELRGRDKPELSEAQVRNGAVQLWAFRSVIRLGDLVAMPCKGSSQFALGTVTQEYWYRHDSDMRHAVSVDWKRTDISRAALRPDLLQSLSRRSTVNQITSEDHVRRLHQLLLTGEDPGPGPEHSIGTDSRDLALGLAELAEELLWEDAEHLRKIERLLRDKRQVIFQGPPGTGKTYVAQALARCLAGSPKQVEIVQFHPSYSYEDFVQGFRPTLKDGRHGFMLNDGPLLKLARRARRAADDDIHVLVIDEINDKGLSRSIFLAEGPRLRLEPDLTWRDGRRCTFVGDAKYKRIDVKNVPNADIYQILAYATALSLPGGLLVYAKGEADPDEYVVPGAKKRLEVFAVDLAGSIRDLHESIDRLAERVRLLRAEALGTAHAA